MSWIKEVIKSSVLYKEFKRRKIKKIEIRDGMRKLEEWEKKGRPVPPPHYYKQKTIKEYAIKYGMEYFIETGTYMGDMVKAQIDIFKKVSSIELSVDLYRRAKEKFSDFSNVKIYQGDSAKLLSRMIDDLPQKNKILFWLDGHYSEGITAKGDKETPIIEELNSIVDCVKDSIILIDDARCFTGKGDYPTLESLQDYFIKKGIDSWKVEDDIIRILVD